MARRHVGAQGLAEAFAAPGLGRNARLERLSALVKWYRFEKLLAQVRDGAGPGRPGYPALLLFKALLVQAWYGLSDAELEEALMDRLSFRQFVGLSLEDASPDHTTLCRFRNTLVAAGLMEKTFAEFDRQLETAGLVLKRGTMLDATLIEAASARPDGPGRAAHDGDAAFAKKNGKTTFGYKAHVGVDEGSGLIRAVATTPANVNDTTPADALIRGDEAAVLADRAYDTHARRAAIEARGARALIMRRGNKHHAPPASWKRFNAAVARRRFAVETTFATLKRRMGLYRARYIGLAKTRAQMFLAALAFNMRRMVALAP